MLFSSFIDEFGTISTPFARYIFVMSEIDYFLTGFFLYCFGLFVQKYFSFNIFYFLYFYS